MKFRVLIYRERKEVLKQNNVFIRHPWHHYRNNSESECRSIPSKVGTLQNTQSTISILSKEYVTNLLNGIESFGIASKRNLVGLSSIYTAYRGYYEI